MAIDLSFDENIKTNDLRYRFRIFTKTFLNSSIRNRWNELFDKDKRFWKKIKPWDLWEDNSCFYKNEWNKNINETIQFIKQNNITYVYVVGLGHSSKFVEYMDIELYSKFIINRCLTENKLYWLEGIILTDNENIAFASNHDGDILLFMKK